MIAKLSDFYRNEEYILLKYLKVNDSQIRQLFSESMYWDNFDTLCQYKISITENLMKSSFYPNI